MKRTVSSLIIAAVAVLAFTASANAQRGERRCKNEINATGSAALTEAGAKRSAEMNWRRSVVLKFGEVFSDFAKAEDSAMQCSRTLMRLHRCDVRGRPCPQETVTATGLPSCSGLRNPKPKCEDFILGVQTAISKKFQKCGPEEVDGVEGKDTVKAIKCAQKELKISQTGELDDATLDALGVKAPKE